MSGTPKTDSIARFIYGATEFVEAKLSRQLETELAEARAEIERLDHQRRSGWTEIKHKERLIKKMRQFIEGLASQLVTEEMDNDYFKAANFKDGWDAIVIDARSIKAALEAAERGGK